MKTFFNKKIFIAFIPLGLILLQHLHIADINLSWLLSLILMLEILKRVSVVFAKPSIFLLTAIIVLFPLISYQWSFLPFFNFNLYFSLLTGLTSLLYIISLSKDEMTIYLKGVFLSEIVFLIWGLYEIFTGNYILYVHPVFANRLNFEGMHYPIVAFSNANDISQYVATLLPVSSIFFFHINTNSKMCKFLIIVVNLLAVYLIFHSESNLSMITFLGTYTIYFLFLKSNNYMSSFKILIVILSIVFVGLNLSVILQFIEKLIDNVLFVDIKDAHFIARYDIYWRLINYILEHPQGGFGNAYALLTPHNLVLYMICDFGIFIGVLFIVTFIKIFYKMIVKFRVLDNEPLYLILIASLIMSPFSTSISSGNEQRKAIWIFFGICIYALLNNLKKCKNVSLLKI